MTVRDEFGDDFFDLPVGLKLRGGPTGEYDDYGNPVLEPDRTVVEYGWYQPASSSENDDRQEQFTYSYTVYLPLDTQLSGVDAVVLFGDVDGAGELEGGVTFPVNGQPQRQPGAFGLPGHAVVLTERMTG